MADRKPDGSKLILIVDDEEADRIGLSAILEGAGYHVRPVESGHAAAMAYVEHRISLVVTDIVMPDGDGVELIRGLKQLRPDLPIIGVSGKGDAGLAAAKAMGAARVLEKPVDSDDLLQAVRQAIGLPGRDA